MLIDLKTPPLVIRLLINLYTKQSMSVKWNNTYSTNFVITGVKQGGVLSSFSVYIWTTFLYQLRTLELDVMLVTIFVVLLRTPMT